MVLDKDIGSKEPDKRTEGVYVRVAIHVCVVHYLMCMCDRSCAFCVLFAQMCIDICCVFHAVAGWWHFACLPGPLKRKKRPLDGVMSEKEWIEDKRFDLALAARVLAIGWLFVGYCWFVKGLFVINIWYKEWYVMDEWGVIVLELWYWYEWYIWLIDWYVLVCMYWYCPVLFVYVYVWYACLGGVFEVLYTPVIAGHVCIFMYAFVLFVVCVFSNVMKGKDNWCVCIKWWVYDLYVFAPPVLTGDICDICELYVWCIIFIYTYLVYILICMCCTHIRVYCYVCLVYILYRHLIIGYNGCDWGTCVIYGCVIHV